MVDTDLGSIPDGELIFSLPFSNKYTGELTGNIVDSMIYIEGVFCLTG